MDDTILRLYPLPGQELALKGAYLSHNLRQRAEAAGKALVVGNFITSLDGRIALPRSGGPGMKVPEATANPRDWRLFQELAVQADILITSGRYLRERAEGRGQEILQVYDQPEFADLGDWRREQGLPPLPDLAVISRSLDFPIPSVLVEGSRSVIVFTTRDADPQRVSHLESQLGKVVTAGEEGVDGSLLVSALFGMGYRVVYSTAGPKVLHLLLEARALDRLYLTFAHRLLGGSPFSSIVEGGLLNPPADFRLGALYFDPYALDGLGQLLATYERPGGG